MVPSKANEDFLIANAYAKINLHLEVLGIRSDGFHELAMVMQSINLSDQLKMIKRADNTINLKSNNKEISNGELLFPSVTNRKKPMSDNTMRQAIFRMGYDGEVVGKSKAVPHGFRATASSILNEEGFNPDAIERQLAHQERNGVRAAYTHHARYKDERIKMMQWWADYLDQLLD